MGGKRPDQHNIDPAEASSTDHKWRGEGRSGDEKILDEDKRHLKENPHDQPMIPREAVNPVLRDLRERKDASRAGDRPTTDDEKVDEASRESFPASDPPPHP
jgi:hypothetical protein